jgi:ammonia channel protein AmtB
MTIEKLISELPILSAVIVALVAWIKQMGVTGRWLTASAFAVGLLLGLAYRYAVQPMATFADWFWAVVFGLLAGAIATGAYKVIHPAEQQ